MEGKRVKVAYWYTSSGWQWEGGCGGRSCLWLRGITGVKSALVCAPRCLLGPPSHQSGRSAQLSPVQFLSAFGMTLRLHIVGIVLRHYVNFSIFLFFHPPAATPFLFTISPLITNCFLSLSMLPLVKRVQPHPFTL